jgi:hypothetical protein
VNGDILHAARFGLFEIVAAGIAAIGGGLPRRRATAGDLAIDRGRKLGAESQLSAYGSSGRCSSG